MRTRTPQGLPSHREKIRGLCSSFKRHEAGLLEFVGEELD
jgi:hypothetical protein